MKQAPMIAQSTATVSTVLPPLPCPTCVVIETPVLAPGVGPHVAAARCRAGHFESLASLPGTSRDFFGHLQ